MSVAATQSKRAISWVFDVAIVVSGALLGLLAVGTMLGGDHFDVHWALALLVGAPIAALMSRFPLVLSRKSTGIEVGFDSAVLVFLACFDGGSGALAV
ncbi:MAG: hypothetical protein ACRDV2_01850, partial [Actinomycetes bacterium]